MSKGGCSGAVDLDFKLGMDMRHHWGWEAADRTEGDSLKVAGCLGQVALAALIVVAI
jgi:hypothetical protein